MNYFKNTELAKLYNVSEKTVRNWIQAAADDKLQLQLHDKDGRQFIANTAKNTTIIEDLVVRGKKYKNTRGYKIIRPRSDFYEIYNHKQIIDIASNLDVYHEIPVQYTYFHKGAQSWDTYTKRLLEEDASNALSNTVELLGINTEYIDNLLANYSGVNVIDLGVGNALPVRTMLQHLLEKNLLKRYIGVDISAELLDMAEANIREWFNGKVKFEGHIRDLVYERFDDLLATDSFGKTAESTINLVFFLGGTLSNFRDPTHALSTIHGSMGKEDLLFFTKKLDTKKTRRFFELAAPGNQAIELVLELLNIDKNFYTLEQTFDEKRLVREVYAKLNVAISIELELDNQKRTIELNKGDSILLWRANHQTAFEVIEQFDRNGFDLLQASCSKDKGYLLTVSSIKIDTVR